MVAVIVSSGAYLVFRDSQVETLDPNQTTQIEQNSDSIQQTEVATEEGEYITYSPEAFSQVSGTRILYFHAPWCPQCRKLEADITKNGVPSGVTIFKVDYDSNQALRRQYGVTLQTTLVRVDDAGQEAAKFVAYDDPTLQAVKNNLL